MTNIELLGIGLGVLGLILSVYFGMKAIGNRQSQRTGKGSIGIQSGRDTKINDR